MARKTTAARMPKFLPASEEMVALFNHLVEDLPQSERRKMFGYPCAFVNGQMFVGVFQDTLMLRLAEEDRARFLKFPGAKLFEPIPGRAMREYVELTPAILASRTELKRWLRRSLVYAQSLPPKVKKPKTKKTAGR